ncbi:PREDICTED: organic solute transporter alpha-like protein isoform X2 [Vollenhovia emeryi]|uniref:organic solute transporter alpha-like protein isoform X2 n=1 Tax=Vollenhovia emeryi TaxID=411798 RepID=UPI0005F549FB|nr:PREDICTED: organic solute transporter alpha-like protein isoform X2 [Vollenhovia emeryi]
MDNHVENFAVHAGCNPNYVPSAIELVESLDALGTALLSVGSIISVLTIYFSANACRNIFSQKESDLYKTNAIIIMSVYPVASVCSLMSIALPRGQLLSEAVTQIFLMISLYRLYLLLLDVGRRKMSETPPLMLRVGPCCCWPCLPFPNLQMTDANLSWIGILVLQLPIAQSLLYLILLYMNAEDTIVATQYGIFLQPFMVISILLGIYGLTIATKTLHSAVPVTCNALILMEMFILCYVARHIYYVDLEKNKETDTTDRTPRTPGQVDATSSNDGNKQPPATVMTA